MQDFYQALVILFLRKAFCQQILVMRNVSALCVASFCDVKILYLVSIVRLCDAQVPFWCIFYCAKLFGQ